MKHSDISILANNLVITCPGGTISIGGRRVLHSAPAIASKACRGAEGER